MCIFSSLANLFPNSKCDPASVLIQRDSIAIYSDITSSSATKMKALLYINLDTQETLPQLPVLVLITELLLYNMFFVYLMKLREI